MLKFIVILILAFPGLTWATCESRLTKSHSPLVGLLISAVKNEAWTQRDLIKFALGEDWSNPFAKRRGEFLAHRYEDLYTSTIADMNAVQLQQARAELRAEVGAMEQANVISEEAARATESVISGRILPGFNPGGLSGSVNHPSKIAWFEGRPVIARPMHKKVGTGNKWGMVLLDPFNPDPKKRGSLIEDPNATFGLATDFFELKGELYAGSRGFAVNLADRSRDLRLSAKESIIDHYSRIVRTSNGPALFRGQYPAYRLLAEDDPPWVVLAPGEYKNERDRPKLANVLSLPSRDIIALTSPKSVQFVDLSGSETFEKFDLAPFTEKGEVEGVRLYEKDGALFAVVCYNVPFESAYYVIVNIRTGTPVDDKIPVQIGALQVLKIEGEPWLLTHFKDGKRIEFHKVGSKGPPHIIPVTGLQSFTRSFRFRGKDFLVWGTVDGLTVCDPSDWSLIELPLPNFSEVRNLQVVEYQNNVYLVADVSDHTPMLIQLTTPGRGPASVSLPASACELRLSRARSPLVSLLLSAVEREVWTEREFLKFCARHDWTNPFRKTTAELLTPRYIDVYDTMLASMNAAQLDEARRELEEIVAAKSGASKVAEMAAHATATILAAPKILPGFEVKDMAGFSTNLSKVTIFEGRPLILRPMLKNHAIGFGMLLLDPFNPDVNRRGAFIENRRATFGLAADFFELNGELYAGGRGFAVNLADRSRDLLLEKPEYLVEDNAAIVKTKHGPAVFRGQSGYYRLLAEDDAPWVPVSDDPVEIDRLKLTQVLSLASRDIVVLHAKGFNYGLFVDLSGQETFKKLDIRALQKDAALDSINLFEDRGELLAVASYNIPSQGHYHQLVNIRTGRPVGDPLPAEPAPSGLVKTDGHPWIVTYVKDLKLQFVDPLSRISQPIPVTGLKSGVRTFKFRGRDYLLWGTQAGLTVCDPRDWALMDFAIPEFEKLQGLQVVEYSGNVYLVADFMESAPTLIQITTPSR